MTKTQKTHTILNFHPLIMKPYFVTNRLYQYELLEWYRIVYIILVSKYLKYLLISITLFSNPGY